MEIEGVGNESEAQFEGLIQGLIDKEYGCCEDFIDLSTLNGLRENLSRHKEAGEMHPAGIGRVSGFHKNDLVRGDEIKWLEKTSTNVFEVSFFEKIEKLMAYLNRTCYTSLNDCEFHYANYEQHSFYKRHLDQFRQDKGRKYSLVVYLNENWLETDGGNLSIYLDQDKQVDLYPNGGRVVFFKSDEIEHEVHPSTTRNRTSITGWLKSV